MNCEVIPMKESLESMKCNFCYIVVNKKTDVKFFENQNGTLKNPSDGTVIDTGIVSPDYFEFYLQPQFVNQGTATPSHFHVLYDTTGIPLEILEEVTFNMSYYYWGWSGAVRLPAPLKFAEKANAFGSKHLSNTPSERLKDSPYFI
jgi:aubergine-like protein